MKKNMLAPFISHPAIPHAKKIEKLQPLFLNLLLCTLSSDKNELQNPSHHHLYSLPP